MTKTLQNQFEHDFQPQMAGSLQGDYFTPPDKSISHRALLLGAVAQGTTRIDHLLQADDIQTTMAVLRQLGIKIVQSPSQTLVFGQGGFQFKPKTNPVTLDFGNAGTSLKLCLGLLSAQSFTSHLQGDASLSHRNLSTVLAGLTKMGAHFQGKTAHLPLTVLPQKSLQGITYDLPEASAQLKSALILAALQAKSTSNLLEVATTRDHTERLLRDFGASLQVKDHHIRVQPQRQPLPAQHLVIPGDPSTAAFMLVAALLLPQSHLIIRAQSLNPTRIGLIHLLLQNQFPIKVKPDARLHGQGDIEVTGMTQRYPALKIDQNNLGGLIDEIPLISLLATQLQGETVISDAQTLREKETDRLHAIYTQLRLLGANIKETRTGLVINGPTTLKSPERPLDAAGDHRMAMMLIVAELCLQKKIPLRGVSSIAISNPTFLTDLLGLLKRRES